MKLAAEEIMKDNSPKLKTHVPEKGVSTVSPRKLLLGRKSIIRVSLSVMLLFLASPSHLAYGFDPPQFFEENCEVCHTIGEGTLVGPDLKDVTERKDPEWLIQFMLDPEGMIEKEDPYALKLLERSEGVIMPPVEDVTSDELMLLLEFIKAESRSQKGEAPVSEAVEEEPSAPDAARGNQLFTGAIALKSGAPPCISCHTGMGPDVGGTLGPDLKAVFSKLGGRRGLASWLSSPPTTTMKSLFKERPLEESEISTLVDLFETWNDMETSLNHDPMLVSLTVIFCGLGGTSLVFVIFGGLWSRRFSGVRRALVERMKRSIVS